MDFMEIFQTILGTGEAGVGIAQLITALNPASWWASGVLTLVQMLLNAIGSVIA